MKVSPHVAERIAVVREREKEETRALAVRCERALRTLEEYFTKRAAERAAARKKAKRKKPL